MQYFFNFDNKLFFFHQSAYFVIFVIEVIFLHITYTIFNMYFQEIGKKNRVN